MKRQNLLSWICLILTGLLVSVHNGCSGVGPSDSLSKSQSIGQSQNSGGQTYDGKPYEVIIHAGPLCADGSAVRSRIVAKSASMYVMDRDNCMNLPVPQVLNSALINLDVNSGNLMYLNQIFVGSGSQTALNAFVLSCQNSSMMISILTHADKSFAGDVILTAQGQIYAISGKVNDTVTAAAPPPSFSADASATVNSLEILVPDLNSAKVSLSVVANGQTVNINNSAIQCAWISANR